MRFRSVFCLVFCGFLLLIGIALFPPLPSPDHPVLLYSNQSRDDLRLVYKRLFAKARSSIDVTMYAATDPELLEQLLFQGQRGIEVTIRHDRSNPIHIPKNAKGVKQIPIKTKGLMHRKIVIIDDRFVILGSANLTPSSLVIHDNLSVGIDSPPLARFLKHPDDSSFRFAIGQQTGIMWLLPDPNGLPFIQRQLQEAQKSVFIAMFTLTHPEILETLIQLHQRGVAVTIAVDYYSAKGASKKAVRNLLAHGIEVLFSHGMQLLHHKWAYIDQQALILGSTNWTKAAFSQNQDCFLTLYSLSRQQRHIMEQLCETIRLESQPTLR